MMSEFHFAQPEWLYAGGAAVVALLTLAALGAWRRRRALARFAGTRIGRELSRSVSGWRRGLKLALLAGGVASVFCALAQPRWGYHFEETERRGVDILFAVDTSRSMLADDLAPDRLTRAKLAVSDLVREFEGDRAGLVAFAGEAFLQVPMTVDRDVFERSLAALDTEIIPRGGTDLGAAIREATAAYGDVADEKLLVLITDGENLEGDAVAAAREAAEAGVRIFTVGAGSADGALITVRGPNGPELVRDEAGQPVRSRLDEATLREIAEITGGAYEPLGASGAGLARLYAEHLSHLPRHAVAARQHRVFHERFQWPLGLGILLLLLEPLIGERRRFGLRRKKATGTGLAPAGAAAAAMLLASAPAFAQDFAVTQRLWDRDASDARAAAQAYDRGEYDAARETWSRSARPEHRFNAGAAAYRAGDWDAAAEAFEGAVRGGDPSLQQRAYYDLGNARFRAGQATREDDRAATKAAWRDAIESYESALALDGADADARHNLEVVRRALAALEAEERQDPQQQDPQQQSGGAQQDQQQQGGRQDQQQQGDRQDQQQQGGGGQQDQQQQQGGRQDQQQQGASDGDAAEQEGSSGDGSSEPRADGSRGEAQREGGAYGGLRKETDGAKERGERGPESESEAESEFESESGAESGAGAGAETEEEDEPDGSSRPSAALPPTPSREREGEEGSDGSSRPADAAAFAGSTGPGEDVGRLSREQAVRLLRSLRHEQRRFPLGGRRRDAADADGPPTRNW